MGLPKFYLLPLLFLIIVFASKKSSAVEARPLSILPQQGYAKVVSTLGIACECCDGAGGECTSTWTEPCTRLKCLPWKHF
ncbi:hypothetical protein CerSpe_225590 [Prunus speciosa]